LVADVVYGGKPALGLLRQGLHAVELQLEHPISREPMQFTCPPPADFAAGWAAVCNPALK
jgi:23S rRNA pseudouridine1911/1915/1917 synthase